MITQDGALIHQAQLQRQWWWNEQTDDRHTTIITLLSASIHSVHIPNTTRYKTHIEKGDCIHHILENIEKCTSHKHVSLTAVEGHCLSAVRDISIPEYPHSAQDEHNEISYGQQEEDHLQATDTAGEGAGMSGVQVVPVPETGHEGGKGPRHDKESY